MTLRASVTSQTAPLEPTAAAPAPGAASLTSLGTIVGGTPQGDVIYLSQRALAIVRAGQAVRAFVIAGLETLRRTVALGAHHTLRLDSGIYQLV